MAQVYMADWEWKGSKPIKKCFYSAIKDYFNSIDFTKYMLLGVREFDYTFNDENLIKEGCLGFLVEDCYGFEGWGTIYLNVSLDYYIKNEEMEYEELSSAFIELYSNLKCYDNGKLFFDSENLPDACDSDICNREIEVSDVSVFMGILPFKSCNIYINKLNFKYLNKILKMKNNHFYIDNINHKYIFDSDFSSYTQELELKQAYIDLYDLSENINLNFINFKTRTFKISISTVDCKDEYNRMLLETLYVFLYDIIQCNYLPDKIDLLIKTNLNHNLMLNYNYDNLCLDDILNTYKEKFKSLEII